MDVITKELRVMNLLLSAGTGGMHAYGIAKQLAKEKTPPRLSLTTVYTILGKYKEDGWLGVEHRPNDPITGELPKSVYRIEQKGIEHLNKVVSLALKKYEQIATQLENARKWFEGLQ